MAQIREFESTTESYFILDGVSYPKVYEAMLDNGYSDTKIKLVGTNRDTTPLVFSTQYTNIRVDDVSFDTALEAISRLNQIVFSKGGGSGDGGTGSNGDVLEKDSAAEGGVKWSNRLTTAENEIDDLYIGQAKITTTTSITTNTLSTTSNLKQNGRNVLIANGVNAINISCETTSEAKFQAIYHKLGSANITFVAGAGATLVLIDGTAIMTGAAGFQTASLHRDGNTFYLQISNR